MSTEQFNRKVTVRVGRAGEEGKEFEGLRISFQVSKTLEIAPNPASIIIYNLSEESRTFVRQPRNRVVLTAGYEGSEKVIYQGDVASVVDKRDRADWATLINAGDGESSYQNTIVDRSFGPGAKVGPILDQLIEATGLVKGFVTSTFKKTDEYPNGLSLSGFARDHLTEILNKQNLTWSVQDNAIQVLGRGEFTQSEVVVISPETGLVGSPQRKTVVRPDLVKPLNGKVQESGVNFIALLNPNLVPGRRVQVVSRQLNGVFVVQKVTHRGDTHENDYYSEVEAR